MVEVRKFSAPKVSLKRCMSPGDSLAVRAVRPVETTLIGQPVGAYGMIRGRHLLNLLGASILALAFVALALMALLFF
jgi:hypothetical protein